MLRTVLAPLLLAAAAAGAALVDSGLSYEDAADDWLEDNPVRGAIAGGWHRAAPGETQVLSLSRYSTPLWNLAAFSAGNDYGNRGTVSNQTTGVVTSVVGGADIPIDDATLAAWSNTLAAARANGAYATPRFAYGQTETTGCEPADFEVLLGHLRQIAGVLNAFTDVVVSVECGMIGPWGEMHSSKYEPAAWSTRVIRAWLDELDPSIKLQVRAPQQFVRLLPHEGSIRGSEFMERRNEVEGIGRIGLFNDGWFGTAWDYGTFTNPGGWNNLSREEAVVYLEERRDIPYGGEMASVSAAAAHAVLDWFATNGWGRPGGWNVVEEWYRTHLAYLRGLYGGVSTALGERFFSEARYAFDGVPDLHEWEGRTMKDFLRAHMGHRFVLRSSRLSDAAAPGGTLQLAFDVENAGFGDLFLPTKSEVLLQAADDRFWACPVALDLGAAVPSRTNASLSLSLRLPSDLTNGLWRVYLRTHAVAAGDSPCAAGLRTVRFANAASQWSAALGANLLGTVAISGAAAEPGLDFREAGAAAPGGTAPQLVLAALPAGAAPSVPLSEWSGRALCLFAPGASNVRYYRAGTEIPSTDGVATLPSGDAALGLYSVRYVLGGAALSRDLFVVVPDGWAGRTWRLETRAGRLRAVCDATGEETDPAPGYDRGLPGRAMEGEPAVDAKLVFASSGNEFVADPATAVVYPAFVVSGLPAGGGTLGGLRCVTVSSGGGSAIDSNNSGNLNAQAVPLAADGAYLTDIDFKLVNWISPYTFGTIRSLALNDPTASRGGASANLEGARLATLGLFRADPGYHVWFCAEDWSVLCETSGDLAKNYRGNLHAIPIPAATNLFSGEAPPAFASTAALCRRLRGWRNLDGSAPGWALGSVALVADYAELPHEWVSEPDPAGGTRRRCTACGFVLGVPRFAGEGAVRFDGTDGPRLRVRIADAAAGAWYTAFSAESLDGPFLAEAASVYARTAGELAFDIDATPAAKFVVVAASSAPFDAGDALPR